MARHSPMPMIRNRPIVTEQPEVIVQPTSPAPQRAETVIQRLPASSQSEAIIQPRSPIPTPRNAQSRSVEPSPSVRRRTEPPARVRNVSQIQNNRTRVEPSPTALLLNKLFRNRDPRLLPEHPSSEISPLTPTNSRRPSPRLPELHIHEESIYSEIPTAPIPTEPDDDDSGSEYLSIDNLSLNLNLDSIRCESITPPPAYRSIFDDEKR